MKPLLVIVVTLSVVAIAGVWAAGGNTLETYESNDPVWTRPVTIANWPDPQNVSGTVEVGNLPAVQQVEVVNFPPADGAPRFQIVGFTVIALTGDQGLLGYTAACLQEFPDSRMCTLDDVRHTTVIPDLSIGSEFAWVDPQYNSVNAAWNNGNCDGWSRVYGGNSGMTIDAAGRFYARACSAPRSVACCAPVE